MHSSIKYLTLAVVLASCQPSRPAQPVKAAARPAKTVEQAQGFQLQGTTLDGSLLSLQDYRGQIVLLDFWAVGCKPCVAEMPNLQKIQDTYPGVKVIGVCFESDTASIQQIVEKRGVTYTQIKIGEIKNSEIARKEDISFLPTKYLIDKNGVVRNKYLGKGGELEKGIEQLLSEK